MRDEGCAVDVEEYAENLCCVSVPVQDPNDGAIVAAISVAMPKIRFKRAWCRNGAGSWKRRRR